jgi:hypothetical protein
MKLERIRPTVTRITLHAIELAALMAAARWVTEGCPGELPADSIRELREILARYDRELMRAMRTNEPSEEVV